MNRSCQYPPGVPPEADSGYAILPTFPDTSYETSFPKLELVQSRGTLHFVGWVEPAPDFVGFRCTQPNLHFAGSNAQCETPTTADFGTELQKFLFRFDRPLFWPAAGLKPDT